MRILLIGEYSRLHNSLKEGLRELGHEVILIANGDGFKNYPADLSTKPRFFESKIGSVFRKLVYKMVRFDCATIEIGIRFYLFSNRLKDFDAVQLINEAPIQTTGSLERFLLKRIFSNNKKVFLLSCGIDYFVASDLMQKKQRYSIMTPYFENPEAKKEYGFILDYLNENHKKTHDLVYNAIAGVMASDIDYLAPSQNHPKFLGLIPNPVNTDLIKFIPLTVEGKISIFLGINSGTYYSKGISFFEKALEQIKILFPNQVEIVVAQNLPYHEYIEKYNKAHIILDQVYGFDQGYNALEAMAKGKVVFTGAEQEFQNFYNLTDTVAINALPDVDYLVGKISYLIENPSEITQIGTQAKAFIEKEHHFIEIAKRYETTWTLGTE